ncbi:MAG: tRNA pseudouridine(55) synthase TruB [Bacteroidetes bacterium]|nr:tRNA pseudouridine(55) synthase TruB [Bacteroidota bacterium]
MEQFASVEGGVLLLDKPSSWTSFDVVKKVRATLRVRKVGHAGTLDPMATGLLVLCSGPMTKRIDTYQAQEKTYTGTLRLGAVTPSFDAETPPTDEKPYDGISTELLRNTTVQFTGEIRQIPPMYSAVKVDGKRLYALARKGKEIEREARIVRVQHFDIDRVNLPEVDFTVICSKGTYVRTLVHDMGQTLGCGAYLTALRRTAIGSLQVADAWTIDAIVQATERYVPGGRPQEDNDARSSES